MDNNAIIVWEKCLSYIQDNIDKEAFDTWFLPTKAVKLVENILTIQVPSKFFYEWLEDNYITLLKSALLKVLGPDGKLVYSIVTNMRNKPQNPDTVKIPSINKEKVKPNLIDAPLKIESNDVLNPFVIPGLQKIKIDSQLNYRYNFDNFIEGESNRLARTAGKAIAKRPGGTSFNPFFIYGGVGLGKTHLVHAIGQEIKELYPDKSVLYVSTEKFTMQFINAVANKSQNDFVHFYQMIDVLIIDDIQFLAGKAKTQEAFFHIFNDLQQKGKQIILTSDKSPATLTEMEPRLISRFKWGLNAELQMPDASTRRNIIQQKVEKDGIEIPETVLDYIAENVETNVRELEGTLNSIIAQSTFNRKEITLDLVKDTLSNIIQYSKKEISIDYIQKTVCDYFKIPIEDIQSRSRKRDVVQARHLAMYFAKIHTKASLKSIGDKIGNRDHATVLHACKTVTNLSETDKIFKRYIEEINKKLTV
ncbi:chromosomal replication initiator protein DnaA [Weeksella virosa]|uniref:chromosomal replication initiator protein DnaA n=1 Tax=Weeksella virosa TaxID=1014 RepID=UPI002555C1C1|nr:chromosomal replication initiator protein DnaA [Weeksella virosa]MDK7675180.1 chromosomal replication initiator protein DnaA [Weeksella virosa]